MRLFADPAPPARDGVELRCCSCLDLIEELERDQIVPDLVIADPPWLYSQEFGATTPEDHYPDTLPTSVIASTIGRCPGRLMVLWLTFPLIPEWAVQHDAVTFRLGASKPWRCVTGGAWGKSDGRSGAYGPGYWWAGCAECVWVYARPGAHNSRAELRNVWMEPPSRHSAKPIEWQAQMVRRWCPPGGLVFDPYAGLGTVARAVLRAGEGRRYIGAEISPERHARAMSAIAMERA